MSTYPIESVRAAIPPSEQLLETLVAERLVTIDGAVGAIEGLCFDRKGDLFFTAIYQAAIYMLAKSGRVPVMFSAFENGTRPSAVKIHRDGRLFIPCTEARDGSKVFIFSPEGKTLQIFGQGSGHIYDDLVFDSDGGFYFSDLSGSTAHPTGGAYYVDPALSRITPILTGLNGANGIALSPDERTLWVTEHGANKLHCVFLGTDRVSIGRCCSSTPYYFCGCKGPDSCCIDAEGNLYVAMFRQGRYLVFNDMGIPVRQILIPERAEGRMLLTTHPAIRPGTDELYLTASDEASHETAIYVSRALAPAYKSYQFQ